jgi:UDP-N-acetylmuramyl pentapeptide phosphotransferase/UDP-N-acetylglucosamine-1-phosphate transferase
MFYLFARNAEAWLAENNLDWAFRVLYQVQFRALAAAALAFLIVLVFGRKTIRILTRLKIGDTGATDAELLRSQARSKANIPTMGGVLIAGAILISCLLLADITQFYAYSALIVLVWLAAVGGVDDYLKLTSSRRGSGSRQGLYAWEKLVFQVGIGVLIGLFAYTSSGTGGTGTSMAHVLNLPFQKTYIDAAATPNPALVYLPKAVFILIMMLMMAGMSNAVNITDGMDGLAGGISAAVALGLCILALVSGTQGLGSVPARAVCAGVGGTGGGRGRDRGRVPGVPVVELLPGAGVHGRHGGSVPGRPDRVHRGGVAPGDRDAPDERGLSDGDRVGGPAGRVLQDQRGQEDFPGGAVPSPPARSGMARGQDRGPGVDRVDPAGRGGAGLDQSEMRLPPGEAHAGKART